MNNKQQIFKQIAKVRNIVISHPQFDAAYEALLESYEMNNSVGVAQQYLLVGESGTGKSTIKGMVAHHYPTVQLPTRKSVPVLVIDTPSLPSVKNLAEEFLVKLGDPSFARGSAIDKTSRLLGYLEACEVKLVIIDEFQHFVDQGKIKAPREVSDWLKSVIDRANVATVLMGLERAEKILDINDQLRRRFTRRLELRPFSIDDAHQHATFVGVLEQLQGCFDFPERLDFQQTELVCSMHYATNGIIDYMVKLLIGAYEVAQRLDCRTINLRCLEMAFTESIWVHGIGELNPFNKKFVRQRLDKRGMPFYKETSAKVD